MTYRVSGHDWPFCCAIADDPYCALAWGFLSFFTWANRGLALGGPSPLTALSFNPSFKSEFVKEHSQEGTRFLGTARRERQSHNSAIVRILRRSVKVAFDILSGWSLILSQILNQGHLKNGNVLLPFARGIGLSMRWNLRGARCGEVPVSVDYPIGQRAAGHH